MNYIICSTGDGMADADKQKTTKPTEAPKNASQAKGGEDKVNRYSLD